MFNDKQLQLLNKEVDSNRVKSRSKSNVNISYLEGFDIIETANKIFGYGNWSYNIKKLEQVSQDINNNQNLVICYRAIISVIVYDIAHLQNVSREDVGFGTGIAKNLAEAHEGGAKEAVTDAIKRAMRSFGNQFGNSLYDKSRNNPNNQNNSNQQQNQNNQNSQTQYNGQSQNQGYSQNQTQQQRVQNFNANQQYPNNQQQQQYQQQQPQQYQHQNISQNQNQNVNQGVNQNNQDYTALYNLGLTVIDQGENLIVIGDDLFSKKNSIKAYGFRWDTNTKLWYKPKDEQVA